MRYFLILDGHGDQDAVVLAFLADTPFHRGLVGKAVDGFPFQGIEGENHHLGRGFGLQVFEHGIEPGPGAGVENPRQVHHVLRGLRRNRRRHRREGDGIGPK